MNTAALDALARSLTGPFAFCGIAVSRPGQTHYAIGTADGIKADPDTIFRVASISKIITAAVFEGAANYVGLEQPYDVDVRDVLPLDVRSPNFPAQPVTLGMLLTHTSGLWDDGGYLFDGRLSEGFDAAQMFGPDKPGTCFRYSNLGYILLAAAAEKLSGERFDLLVADALSPNDIRGSFNWLGVAAKDLQNVLPTFRRSGRDFVAQIDTQPIPAVVPDGYVLGEHTAIFSPQGGLRMSLSAMLGLAQVYQGGLNQPQWRSTDGPGEYCDGLFEHYGAGLQYLDAPPFYPRPLIGHFANAYGFKGGVWCDEDAGLSFAYALNGFPVGDESDDLSVEERDIFNAIAAL
ncbi:beta-lactamase family protein [Yoonia sp. F2084L]|uniref:serine hydrolase domain-containing protein n=1 Tax=Yoonia sp. F2084L TaxID=2926419 RepID=UPI001FF304BE|nr:serine hydrolase domain-containing protein [Yoonia sp. F2084L]MCK0095989.1 beta-lactamase family protein [Yoonia sp. F2084L]